MKKLQFKQLMLILLTVVGVLLSCKKGEQGPQGAQGETGLQGPQGVQGTQGPAGSIILSGNGNPAASLGKSGDFYLDVTKSELYGPKSALGWGDSLNLVGAQGIPGAQGAQGANGQDGKGILSGNGIPVGSFGANGDYYIDRNSYNIYGPKMDGAWGVPTALQGPQGPMGNANVKVDVFDLVSADWNIQGEYVDGSVAHANLVIKISRAADRAAASLTSAFLAGPGVVMVYYLPTSFDPNSWRALPNSIKAASQVYTHHYAYDTLQGRVRLHYYRSGTDANTPPLATFAIPPTTVKIVVLTGTVVASLNAAKIDQNDQAAVKKFLGLAMPKL